MLKVGDVAPAVSAQDADGNRWSLTDAVERGPLVLYFYPADFTPVCTREACAFRDSFAALDAANVQIVGVSPQGMASHRRFREQYALPFTLLADERKEIVRAFGVDGPFGFGVRRVTFLIGTDRRIVNRAVADFSIGSHMDLIKEVIAAR